MRKLFFFLSLALFAFVLSFSMARYLNVQPKNSETEIPAPFAPASYSLKNRSFTIVIVGYNNGGYVEKTLSSVFAQSYDNFHILYIDDASDDGSFDVVRDIICESNHLVHVTLVRNEERLGQLANIYRAVSALNDDEIVILLNGEDWLAHEWVLQRLNAYYDDPNLWITLAQGVDYPTYHFAKEPSINGRHHNQLGSHLKSFYAALFKKVRESDFIYSGKFLPTCSELAYMTPMLEMGSAHYSFIPEVLSVNNREVVKEEPRELVLVCEKFIRSLEPYSPITALQVISCGD